MSTKKFRRLELVNYRRILVATQTSSFKILCIHHENIDNRKMRRSLVDHQGSVNLKVDIFTKLKLIENTTMFSLQQEREECRKAVGIIRNKVHSKPKKTNIARITLINTYLSFNPQTDKKRDQLHPRPITLSCLD